MCHVLIGNGGREESVVWRVMDRFWFPTPCMKSWTQHMHY